LDVTFILSKHLDPLSNIKKILLIMMLSDKIKTKKNPKKIKKTGII